MLEKEVVLQWRICISHKGMCLSYSPEIGDLMTAIYLAFRKPEDSEGSWQA